jgi:NAD(P)-dependent dehydrogenase (short-subunit alcohol dehydrogenase family)
VSRPLGLRELDPPAWAQAIDTNLSGSFYMAREAGLFMADHGGGTIVNVASELSLVGAELYVAYAASKAGVVGLTRAMAAELAPSVRVNAVCPGPTDTPMLRAEFAAFPDPAAARADMINRIPLRRLARADEVAAAILFLAIDASYAVGSSLVLDGGTTSV